MEIKKTFRFYEHLPEEAFLNEQLKKGYALSFVEQNNYHFKEEKKPDNAYYRIAYYAKQQDLEVLKQALKRLMFWKRAREYGWILLLPFTHR